MKTLDTYPLPELKRIYTTLHAQVIDQPALMDSELLHDLQSLLQQQAKQDGIDVSTHADWASWLSNMNNQN